MDKILFLNACARPGSRTLELAETLLQKLEGMVEEARLQEMQLPMLDLKGLEKRNRASQENDYSDPVFDALLGSDVPGSLKSLFGKRHGFRHHILLFRPRQTPEHVQSQEAVLRDHRRWLHRTE